MSALIYPKGNKNLAVQVLDDSPLYEYLAPFLDLANSRFDSSIDIYGGDQEFKINEMRGLFLLRDLIRSCLDYWDSFYNLHGVNKVDRDVVDKFYHEFNTALQFCVNNNLSMILDAD